MNRIFIILKIILAPLAYLSLPWGYIYIYMTIIVKSSLDRIYPRSQVRIYRITGPLVVFYS